MQAFAFSLLVILNGANVIVGVAAFSRHAVHRSVASNNNQRTAAAATGLVFSSGRTRTPSLVPVSSFQTSLHIGNRDGHHGRTNDRRTCRLTTTATCCRLSKSSSSELFSSTNQNDNGEDSAYYSSKPPDNVSQDSNHSNWTSQTLAIALPALAGMMTDPLLSMVDTLFVGRLGLYAAAITNANGNHGGRAASSIPLAALGACTSIFHLCFHCFRATTASTSSLLAGALVRDEQQEKQQEERNKSESGDIDTTTQQQKQQQPHEQQKEAVLVAQTSIQQALFTGVLISSFLLAFGPRCLLAMGVAPGGELYQSAMTYLNHRAIAAPAVIMLSASEGIFRGYGDVITPWKVSCIVAGLNLVLDPFCMFGGKGRKGSGLGMGIKGAAVATAFSQMCGAVLYGRWLFQKGLVGTMNKSNKNSNGNFNRTESKTKQISKDDRAALKQQKRGIAISILRANAAMTAKQGSLLLGWSYATSRATRLGHAVVASHQMALSIWLVVAFVLEGVGVAAQVLMAREWEGLQLLEKKKTKARKETNKLEAKEENEEELVLADSSVATTTPESLLDTKRRTIKSLSMYMMKVSIIQGLIGSLAILLLRQAAPGFILTHDPVVRQNLLKLLPHIATQMALVSVTLVAEALAIGGGRFKWLAGGTTVSSIIAIIKLRAATDLVDIWNGVSSINEWLYITLSLPVCCMFNLAQSLWLTSCLT